MTHCPILDAALKYRAPIWTGQRGNNAGAAEDSNTTTKLQLQESATAEEPGYPYDGEVTGEELGTSQLKKDELGSDDMAQDGIDITAPESAPIAGFTESEERETKEEGGDATEEAAVSNKSEEPWAQEGTPAHDASVE